MPSVPLKALVAIVLLAAFARGQEQSAAAGNDRPLKQLSLEELSQIEVTTTEKEPIQANRTAAATYVITGEEIRRSGATSIPDALRLVPGVEVARISSTTWAIGIRGLLSNFSKSVLVLIDGRSVYTPLFAGVYWDVQDVVLTDVERIEVVRGPGATIWGPNAVNGVINIITKGTNDTQGVLVSAGGGTVDRTIDTVQYGGSVGKNLNYRVYARGFVRAPEFHVDGDNFDGWHEERGGFRSDWVSGPNDLMVEGDLYGGVSPHLVGSTISKDAVSGGNIVARWRRELNNGSDIYVETFFDRTIRIGNQLGETRDTFDVDFLHHLKLGEAQDFSWGGGLRLSPNRVIAPQPGIGVFPSVETDQLYSLFAQDELHFLQEKLSVTLGAKLQYNNFSGFDIQPTVRALYAPNKRQSFWAAVTRAVTTPSRIEEGFLLTGQLAPTVQIQVVGDHNFKSESLIGYEAGYRQLVTPRFYIDLAAFHNNYADLQSFSAPTTSVTNDPPRTLITIAYANAIGGQTNGIEIAPTWQATPWWRLAASYSYVGIDMHANAATSDISSSGSVPTYEGSTPHHEAEVQSTLNLPKGFEFDQFYRWASSLPAQKVPSYQTVDARFGWKPNSQWEFSVVGQNLMQPRHFEWGTGDPSQSLVGVKRAVYASITFTR